MIGRQTVAGVPARDPGMALLRALLTSAPAGSGVALEEMTSTGWASATFVGARHVIRLSATDDGAVGRWLGALPEAQVGLRGHLLVDVAVASVTRRDRVAAIVLEALTIEEA